MKKMSFRDLMVFIILSATVAIAYQIPYLRYTFYDQMMAALQITNSQMAYLATALNITNTISYVIGGVFAAKVSTRNCILISLTGLIGVTIAHTFTTNFIVLMILYILYGLFTVATLWSAYLVGIQNIGSAEIQGKLFGFSEATRGIIQTLCGFLFLAVIGLFASQAAGFNAVLFSGAGVSFILLILAFIFLPKQNIVQEDAIKEKSEYSIGDVLKNKGVWIVTLLIIGAYGSWQLGNGYLTTYTVQVLGISPDLASTLGIVRSYVIVFLAGFLGGWLLDKFTYKGKAFITLLGLSAIAVSLVMLTSKVVPVCIGITLLVAFLANIMKSTYWSTMSQANIPTKMTPLATGAISFVCFLPVDVIVTPMCGRWIDAAVAAGNVAAGFNKIFITIIAFALVGIVAAVMLIKTKKEMDHAANSQENNKDIA